MVCRALPGALARPAGPFGRLQSGGKAAGLPAGTVGSTYSATLTATGGAAPYTWSATGLPAGLSISSSGTITGTPTAAGTQTPSLIVKDANGTTASSSLAVTIGSQAVSVSISPATATVSAGKSQTFTASVTGTTNTGVNWYASGVQGGDANVGLISSSGVYTAPACGSSSAVLITAQSAYVPASQASANVTLTAGTASGLDRYISTSGNDSNDGSACHPWATIQHAANSAAAGMTIHVAPGTYPVSVLSGEKASIDSSASGTAAGHITFISDQQWGAKIISSADTIWTNSGAYVDIVGFDMSGGGTTYTGIHSQGNYARSIGNRIHDFGSTGCVAGGGVMIGGKASNQSAIANIVYNLGGAPGSCGLIHGVYGQENGTIFQNNLVFNVAGKCIQAWGDRATNQIIANNTGVNCNDGLVVGNSGSVSPAVNDNTVVVNNIFINEVCSGIYESGTGTHNTYSNNILYNNPNPCGNVMTDGTLKNTIASDPKFVNYTGDASGDYHLTSSSPAINSGSSNDAPSTDLDGSARQSLDIGAYEYGALPAAWPWVY